MLPFLAKADPCELQDSKPTGSPISKTGFLGNTALETLLLRNREAQPSPKGIKLGLETRKKLKTGNLGEDC